MLNTGTFDDGIEPAAVSDESYDGGGYDGGGYDGAGYYDGGSEEGGEKPPRRRGLIIGIIIAAIAAAAVLFLWFDPLDLNLFRNHSRSAATEQSSGDGKPGASGAAAEMPAAASSVFENAVLQFVSSDVSDYPTVRLYYSLTDPEGDAITLTDPAGTVLEQVADGTQIERAIRSIQQIEGSQGLSIDLVADKSASMQNDLADMQRVMSQFIASMDFEAGDSAEIIAFDSFVMYMCTYTQDPALLQNGIANMSTYGDTALYDALYTAVTNASGRAGARCVIAFTDGEDNRSIHTVQEVISLAASREVPVYIIGTGSADYTALNDICTSTGGRYWDISAISDMSAIMQQIYSTQKQLYCVEYESDPGADPLAPRTVSFTLSERTGTDGASGGGTLGNAGSGGGVSAGGPSVIAVDAFTPTPAVEEQAHTSRYEFIRADVSWTEANDDCIARGGHLVTITSQEEQNQMIALAEQAGVRFVWIGGYTSVRDNAAYGHWITGEPFEYTAWYPGEPSRNDLDGVPEFYLMLWNVNDAWSWNDERNDPIRETGLAYFPGNVGYICEYED